MEKILHIGLDVGSTTVKIVVIDENNNVVYSHYQRHYSDVQHTLTGLLKDVYSKYKDDKITMNVTGSSGMSTSEQLGL
ncbi:MAG: hypothetical protein WCR27_00755, partial [Eubacteriales bacterium]